MNDQQVIALIAGMIQASRLRSDDRAAFDAVMAARDIMDTVYKTEPDEGAEEGER